MDTKSTRSDGDASRESRLDASVRILLPSGEAISVLRRGTAIPCDKTLTVSFPSGVDSSQIEISVWQGNHREITGPGMRGLGTFVATSDALAETGEIVVDIAVAVTPSGRLVLWAKEHVSGRPLEVVGQDVYVALSEEAPLQLQNDVIDDSSTAPTTRDPDSQRTFDFSVRAVCFVIAIAGAVWMLPRSISLVFHPDAPEEMSSNWTDWIAFFVIFCVSYLCFMRAVRK